MDMEKAIDNIMAQYADYTDAIMFMSFINEVFSKVFREQLRLTSDEDYVRAVETFMKIEHEIFHWNDYLKARTTAEKAFRLFYEQQHYPKDKLDIIVTDFIISFFNACIDDNLFQWMDAHPNEEYPAPPEDDIDNLTMARAFSCISYREEDEAFCESIGVRYHYEQLHMCCWFSGQLTNGFGKYSRNEANYSARSTYNHLRNEHSLLWIGVVLGADKNELKAAAAEMKGLKSIAAQCGAVRRHVPFDVILSLFQKLMEDTAE